MTRVDYRRQDFRLPLRPPGSHPHGDRRRARGAKSTVGELCARLLAEGQILGREGAKRNERLRLDPGAFLALGVEHRLDSLRLVALDASLQRVAQASLPMGKAHEEARVAAILEHHPGLYPGQRLAVGSPGRAGVQRFHPARHRHRPEVQVDLDAGVGEHQHQGQGRGVARTRYPDHALHGRLQPGGEDVRRLPHGGQLHHRAAGRGHRGVGVPRRLLPARQHGHLRGAGAHGVQRGWGDLQVRQPRVPGDDRRGGRGGAEGEGQRGPDLFSRPGRATSAWRT